jgi:hypothetical protein
MFAPVTAKATTSANAGESSAEGYDAARRTGNGPTRGAAWVVVAAARKFQLPLLIEAGNCKVVLKSSGRRKLVFLGA